MRRCSSRADGDWVTYGRDYAETHHSPLTQIDSATSAASAWRGRSKSAPRARSKRRRSCSNGVLYGTSTWSAVYAVDVRTGKLKWRWDPALVRGGYRRRRPARLLRPGESRRRALQRPRLRRPARRPPGRARRRDRQAGVGGADHAARHATTRITGAPRIVKGKVVIGNGGAEYGVRGFLTAYDADTGKLAWSSTSCPAIRRSGSKIEALARAAKTWNGRVVEVRRRRHAVGRHRLRSRSRTWSTSAPATARRGTRNHRSPGGGDNLYLVVDRRAQRRHRQVRVALPDDARRQLGLQRRAADDPGRPHHRRTSRAR